MNLIRKIAHFQSNSILLLLLVAFFQLTLPHLVNLKTDAHSFENHQQTTKSRLEKKSFSNLSSEQVYDDGEEFEIKKFKKKHPLLSEVNTTLLDLLYSENISVEVYFIKKFYHKKNNLYLLFCNLKHHLTNKQ